MTERGPIIFPTDFSEASLQAVPWVMEMADTLGAKICCVHVVEQPLLYGSLEMTASPQPAMDEMQASASSCMQEWLGERLTAAAGRVRGEVLTGRAADEIVALANTEHAAMIVMTTHGYTGIRHLLLGSTTEEVLRRAPCPVLVIRSREK